ncbi:hypothetical protein DR64_8317 [Paraburkholderia xenovorans LB400]|uniref:Uncharacterized protein n=1 Tax=Paraburkholderia xenovorans (strain LB400) TaxID=266265 RepID=Q13IQ4_PARXL|nr:hypothetical protein [Paraburkholderia xenovorans]ABE36035.1 Conserved hypothetical protein [Paraburkholderia xenovorans LB400]AIP34555.1 hypothetical protein DR64_8317 [Paraburkholderia xenovorans LB400]
MAEVVSDNHQRRIYRLGVPDDDALAGETARLIARQGGDNGIRALSLNAATARRFTRYFEHLSSADGNNLPLAGRVIAAGVVPDDKYCGPAA